MGLALGSVAGEELANIFELVPANQLIHAPRTENSIPAVATLLTYMFSHGSLLHLAENMIYLWISVTIWKMQREEYALSFFSCSGAFYRSVCS